MSNPAGPPPSRPASGALPIIPREDLATSPAGAQGGEVLGLGPAHRKRDPEMERLLREAMECFHPISGRVTEDDIKRWEDYLETINPTKDTPLRRFIAVERRKAPRHTPLVVDFLLVLKGVGAACWCMAAIVASVVAGYQLGWVEGGMVGVMGILVSALFAAVIHGLSVEDQ